MMDIVTKIMVEVLNIDGIITKEIRQTRTSTSFRTKKFPLTEPFSEKFVKKLLGRTDMEDALKTLDRLTQEESRMASAQVLRQQAADDVNRPEAKRS